MKNKTLKFRKLLTISILAISTTLVACDRNVSIEETPSASEIPAGTSGENDETPTASAEDTSLNTQTDDEFLVGSTDDNSPDSLEEDEPITPPESDEDLYNLLISQLKKGNLKKLYPYAGNTLQYMLTEDSFQYLFGDSLSILGEIKDVEEEVHDVTDSYAHYKGKLIYDHAECAYDFTIRDQRIENIYLNPFFTDAFDQTLDNGITQHFFPLESSGYKLNAAYVKAADDNAPTVLLIAKSGATDYNGLVGTRPILKDLALELAERGISSLRIEKRFYRYSADLKETDGLEKDYFEDYTNAFNWLKAQNNTSKIWLLGHDMGGNIAAALTERIKVDGLVFMNGSARHLADILVDTLGQLSTDMGVDQEFSETLKSITHENAHGATYNATSDYYWADLNDLDTISSLKKAGVPTLIVNSLDDEQLFEGDYELWKKEFGNDKNVTLTFLNGIDHFGYEKSNEESPYYKICNYSDALTDTIAEYIKNN